MWRGLVGFYIYDRRDSRRLQRRSILEELVAQTSYIVNVTPAVNGTVAIGDYEVGEGETLILGALGDTGYQLVGVVGTCGGSVIGGNSIETDPVFADCTFSAAFGEIPPPVTYTVTPSAGVEEAISLAHADD